MDGITSAGDRGAASSLARFARKSAIMGSTAIALAFAASAAQAQCAFTGRSAMLFSRLFGCDDTEFGRWDYHVTQRGVSDPDQLSSAAHPVLSLANWAAALIRRHRRPHRFIGDHHRRF